LPDAWSTAPPSFFIAYAPFHSVRGCDFSWQLGRFTVRIPANESVVDCALAIDICEAIARLCIRRACGM
jgi:hypothetical protein